MATELEYALLSGSVYVTTRHPVNQIAPAPGWAAIDRIVTPTSGGFEAQAYQRGSEIVISYAGTGSWDDWIANISLGLNGNTTTQLEQAILYYEQIKTKYPTSTITFTGHSLGGGLAALMGVYFNRKA